MVSREFFRKGFALGLTILAMVALSPHPAGAVRSEVDTEGMAVIDIDVQNASTASVLRMFSEFSGRNIVAGPEVNGKITAKLTAVPWLQALDTVLRTNGYGWEEMGQVIRVSTLERLNNERLNEEVLERKREEFIPLETSIFRVSYAKADEMKQPLEILLSSRGEIETDERTNALVITDIPHRVARVREMAQVLDYKTPQVEINAKLVDVDARVIRNLGIDWSVTGLNKGDGNVDYAVHAADLPGPVGVVTGGLSGTDADFSATIEMLERQDKAEIISNPRITTADNKEARIIVGKKIPLVVADESGNAITQLTTIGIKLTVIPHINQDDRITLDLTPEVSDLSAQATVQGGIVIVTAEASTRVIVANGQTAVIGGLIRTNESTVNTGVPVLMDIPVIGNLFRNSNKVKEERELLIFVTPKIIRSDA
jgi:type II secretory pathway component HofQ